MLNKKEYLLICLMEELNEVSQNLSKCLRFTAEHVYDSSGLTNLDRVCNELQDMDLIRKLLKEEGVDTYHIDERYTNEKARRTEMYMGIARELACLESAI